MIISNPITNPSRFNTKKALVSQMEFPLEFTSLTDEKPEMTDFKPEQVKICGLSDSREPDWILIDCSLSSYHLLKKSRYCYRSSGVFKLDQIQAKIDEGKLIDLSTELFNNNQDCEVLIIFFKDQIQLLEEKIFIGFNQFYQMVKMIEMYSFDESQLENFPKFRTWLIDLLYNTKHRWNKSSLILKEAYDRYRFDQNKLGTPIVANQNSYPNSNQQQIAKNPDNKLKLKRIKTNREVDPDSLYLLFQILERWSDTFFLPRLITFFLTEISHSQTILESKELIDFCHTRYPKIFWSGLNYALRIYYLEEHFTYHQTRFDDRFVLDLANWTDLDRSVHGLTLGWESNPWNLTSLKASEQKRLTLPYWFEGERGIYSLQQFRRRLAEYSDQILSDPNFPWEMKDGQIKVVACGSTITATLIRNPLEHCYNDTRTYFDTFYPGNQKNRTNRSQSESNSQTGNPDLSLFEAEEDDESIRQSEESDSSEETDTDSSEETDTDSTAGKRFVADIDLMIQTNESPDQTDYPEFNYACHRIHQHLVTKFPEREVKLQKIKTENKHKYKITGLYREIDLFQVESIPGVITKFHLPCVRAWYDGKKLYGLPSFLVSANTGINLDIRWVSCNKDVKDLVLKYFQRGFGTLLNKSDSDQIVSYINNRQDLPNLSPNVTQPLRVRYYWNRPLFHEKKDFRVFQPNSYPTRYPLTTYFTYYYKKNNEFRKFHKFHSGYIGTQKTRRLVPPAKNTFLEEYF